MSRQALVRLLGLVVMFAVALFFSACATNSHSGGFGSGGSGSGGNGGSGSGGSGGSGGPAPGGFAAGIGGAGQTSSASFLIATQVPSNLPIPTRINSNGTLTATKLNAPAPPALPNTPTPMSSAIDPSGTFMYEAVEPGIYGYTINRQTGDLTQMPNMPVNGSQNFDAIAVDQLGMFVYAYGGGQVFAYTIQAGTGQLSPIAGSPFTGAPNGQQFPLAGGGIAVSQNDKFLYVGTGTGIIGYAMTPNSGALTMIAGSPFNSSGGVARALVAPATGFLYETTIDLTGKTNPRPIDGFSIDPNTGALTPIAGSPFTPGCSANNLTSPANGKFLFASGCGMYQINPSTGALTHLVNDPAGTASSWAVFDPTGAFIWQVTTDQVCWHCDTGVTAYQVDPNTGNMTMVPNSFFIMQNSFSGGIQSIAITH